MYRVCLYGFCVWLATLSPAHADIIVTWLDDPIVLFHGQAPSIQVPVDIDGDDVIDFTFSASVSSVGVRSEGSNRYIIFPSPPPNIGGPVEPLYPEFEIGLTLQATDVEWFGINTDFSLFGIWLWPGSSGRFRGHNAYMGIEFHIDNAVHYGWINIDIHEDYPYGRIYGWAYESYPDTPIIAGAIPEPNTLLLLLAGGIGLLFLKSRSKIFR